METLFPVPADPHGDGAREGGVLELVLLPLLELEEHGIEAILPISAADDGIDASPGIETVLEDDELVCRHSGILEEPRERHGGMLPGVELPTARRLFPSLGVGLLEEGPQMQRMMCIL